MQCQNCPLKTLGSPCLYDETGHTPICDLVNPDNPKYNPDMVYAVVRNSTDYYNKLNNKDSVPQPTFIQKIMNLGGAMLRIIEEGGPKKVSDEIYQARLTQCSKCPFKKDDWTCSHPSCGCILEKKAELTTEACPIGLWGFEYLDMKEVDELRAIPVKQMMEESVTIDFSRSGKTGCCGQ